MKSETGDVLAGRAGVVLPLVAILLPVLFVIVLFSIDLSYMQLVRIEMRAAADSAARSAALRLSNGGTNAEVVEVALDTAEKNSVGGMAMKIDSSDVDLGHSVLQQDGTYLFTPGTVEPNAVRVRVRRTADSPTGRVPLFFSRMTGIDYFEPVRSAVVTLAQLDVCLVLDRSSSMKLPVESAGDGNLGTNHPDFCNPPLSGSRWLALDDAVETFVQTIDGGRVMARVGIVSYSGRHSFCTDIEDDITIDQGLTSDFASVRSAMQHLRVTNWNGHTNISQGIRTGITALTDPNTTRPGAKRIMVVVTDGYPTRDKNQELDATREAVAESIQVHALTFGADANAALMEQVAEIGGGIYAHASNAVELERLFEKLGEPSLLLTD